MLCAAILYLLFGLDIFWPKKIGPKAAPEVLMKQTTGVNFNNIL